MGRLLGRWLPDGALERTRCTFAFFSLFVIATVFPALLLDSSVAPPSLLAALAGLVWTAGRHWRLYRTRNSRLGLLPLDGLALLAIGLAAGTASTGVFFTGLYFCSLYGTRLHVTANVMVYTAALIGAVTLGADGGTFAPKYVFVQIPGLVLVAFVMRLVADALHKESRARARERRLREAASELVSAPDKEAVQVAGMSAALSLLPQSGGRRVAIWNLHGPDLVAVAAAGDDIQSVRDLSVPLETLPGSQLEALQSGQIIRIQPRRAGLAESPFHDGSGGVLVAPFHDQDGLSGAMVTSTGGRFPDEVVDALRAIASQVALAIKRAELAEDALRRRSDARLVALVRNASDVITVVNADGVITFQTPSAERVFGYAPDALVGRRIAELVHPDDAQALDDVLRRSAQGTESAVDGEWRLASDDGAWRDVEANASNLLEDLSVQGIVLTSRDVTERRALERSLAHQAFHDALTGLPNRELFRDRVEHALLQADEAGVAVLFVDIDDFKNVNDTLGHAAGDNLLERVAESLRGAVRPWDTTARLGGDEFGILLTDVGDAAEAARYAQRVLDALSVPHELQTRKISVQASVGIAVAHSELGAVELLRNADIALYAAKQDGKRRFRAFEPSMYAATLDRVQLHEDLRFAIEGHQLRLHYQPVVTLPGGEPVGVEALMRWEHPTRGLLAPGIFIGLAEQTGLIQELGAWALQEGCRQLVAWRQVSAAVGSLWLSVNVAAAQLQDPELVDFVAATLTETGLDPGSLMLEITESAVIDDPNRAIAHLHALARLGVRLAIDDFGTGYSSLSYLQRFPLNTLKLDKTFTDQLTEVDGELRLARAIIELGQTLELEVVAEGVERAEQVALLLDLGCRRAQGYLFARPMPPELLIAQLDPPTFQATVSGSTFLASVPEGIAHATTEGKAPRAVGLD